MISTFTVTNDRILYNIGQYSSTPFQAFQAPFSAPFCQGLPIYKIHKSIRLIRSTNLPIWQISEIHESWDRIGPRQDLKEKVEK